MPAPYLTGGQAATRLSQRFGIEAEILASTAEIASDDLDFKGPFIGSPAVETQYRAFPRSVTVQDDVVGTVPSRVLDWVALRAYQLTEEDDAPVTDEKIGSIQVRFARGKRSPQYRLMKNLLHKYRATSGFGRIV